jgi:large subunit ribosomal protein L22
MMEAQCVAKYLRITPRKLRLVADLVRGKNVNDAMSILKFTPKAGARPALKAIQSAVANIVNKDDSRSVDPDTLLVRTIFVDEGPTLKRYLPRAMGRATPIRKRMSHLTVWVASPPEPSAESETPAAEEKAEKKETRAKRKVAAPKAKVAKGKTAKSTGKARPKKAK